MHRSLFISALSCGLLLVSSTALAAEPEGGEPSGASEAAPVADPAVPEAAVDLLAEAEPATCEHIFTVDDVEAILEFASDTWAALDAEGFLASTSRLKEAVPCLEAPLSGRQAAEILRWEALGAFMERDPDAASRWFASARIVDPYFRFPAQVVPPGNPLSQVYDESASLSGAFSELRPPAEGALQLNGRLSLQRPDDWPVIVQITDAESKLTYTGLLMPGDPMPDYAAAAEGANLGVKYDSQPIPLHRSLYAGSAATGTVAVVLWAAGLSAKQTFQNNTDPVPFNELSGTRARANTLTGTSLFLAATSGALAFVGHKSRSW